MASNLIRTSLCIFVVVAANVAGAESLGRLFFTPKERVALDRGKAGQPAELVEAQPGEPKRSAEMNGYVVRSNSKDTVWLDGLPHYGADPVHLSPSLVRSPGSPIVVRRSSHSDANSSNN